MDIRTLCMHSIPNNFINIYAGYVRYNSFFGVYIRLYKTEMTKMRISVLLFFRDSSRNSENRKGKRKKNMKNYIMVFVMSQEQRALRMGAYMTKYLLACTLNAHYVLYYVCICNVLCYEMLLKRYIFRISCLFLLYFFFCFVYTRPLYEIVQ